MKLRAIARGGDARCIGGCGYRRRVDQTRVHFWRLDFRRPWSCTLLQDFTLVKVRAKVIDILLSWIAVEIAVLNFFYPCVRHGYLCADCERGVEGFQWGCFKVAFSVGVGCGGHVIQPEANR